MLGLEFHQLVKRAVSGVYLHGCIKTVGGFYDTRRIYLAVYVIANRSLGVYVNDIKCQISVRLLYFSVQLFKQASRYGVIRVAEIDLAVVLGAALIKPYGGVQCSRLQRLSYCFAAYGAGHGSFKCCGHIFMPRRRPLGHPAALAGHRFGAGRRYQVVTERGRNSLSAADAFGGACAGRFRANLMRAFYRPVVYKVKQPVEDVFFDFQTIHGSGAA